MRNTPNVRAERYRVRMGRMGSDRSYGNNGCFVVRCKDVSLQIIASDEGGFDHVSVVPLTNPERTPTWEEMCFVKELFFRDDEVAVQLHPAKDRNINNHNFCLHLWRPQAEQIPLPPDWMVGIPLKEAVS